MVESLVSPTTSFKEQALNLFSPQSEDPLIFDVDAIAAAWETATGGVTGPFAVGERQYVLGLFRPTTVPGVSDSGSAFAWELLQDGGDSGTTSGGLPGSRSDASCGSRSINDYESLGGTLDYVRGGFFVTNRGVTVAYTDGEPCRTGDVPHHVSIVFLCQVSATFSGTPAHKDGLGVYHLDRLRMGGYALSQGQDARCANVTLEWLTSAACPRCRRADYTPHAGECGKDGYRQVSFSPIAEACIGGISSPAAYREKCKDSAQDEDKMKGIVEITVGVAAFLFVSLCGYACHLHRKYAHMVPEL